MTMKCLLVLPLLFFSVASQTEDPCGGGCSNGALCESGPGPNPEATFEEVGNIGDYHCECTSGWTGKLCDIAVQDCGLVEGIEHFCFNGGQCVYLDGSTVAEPICNCTSATDEDQSIFTGKSCEHKLSDAESCESGSYYCLNNGTCGLTAQMQPECACKDGYSGSRCQYESDEVPECVLKCQNGGTCELGFRNPTVAEQTLLDMEHNQVNSNVQHCLCADGFHGVLCQVGSESCGTQSTVANGAFEQAPNSDEIEHHCFHGSKCITTQNLDGTLQHNCDCSSANNDTHYFAGLACQFHQTSFCDKGNTLDGNAFCVNGGQCLNFQDGGVFGGCECPPEWKGLHCELPAELNTTEYDTCQLKCLNGGVCRKGVKDHGIMNPYTHELVNVIGPQNAEPAVNAHGLEYCECTSNYTGVFCGVEAETCADGKTFCLHGSSCKEDSKVGWKCDCLDGTLVAGRFCHKEADDVCHSEDPSANAGAPFCVNGGTCFINVAGLSECKCPPSFTGRHCEWGADDDDDDEVDSNSGDSPDDDAFETDYGALSDKNDAQAKVIISLSVLFVGAIFVMIVVVCTTHCRGKETVPKGDSISKDVVAYPPAPPVDSFQPSPPAAELGSPGPPLPDLDTALNEVERNALDLDRNMTEDASNVSEGTTPMDEVDAELI